MKDGSIVLNKPQNWTSSDCVAICRRALRCKGIKKVTLGKNVAAIGSKAFFNCSNLKTITIKTKLLKKSNVGSKAFKGIKKKATFKVPKKKFKAYKKMLKKRGATKKMKFKKIKKL